MLIHVVKPGETLWQISNYYRVSITAIQAVNELPDPDIILVGQALVIPVTYSLYTVKPGDTLWRIAQSYGTSIQRIVAANNIQNADLIYPGMVLIIPDRQRPLIEVNGYIYTHGPSAVPIVLSDGDRLTYLSTFAYLIREDGSLSPIRDDEAIAAAYSKNVVPMMSITNFTTTSLGENLAHVVLANPEISNRLIANLINIMKQKGYRGINIDFENVLPGDRELYNSFLQLTVNRMHAEGFYVSTALAPKVSSTQTGLLYEAHDYEAHGRIADFVILMTYEWGWRKGPPQAISPLNQIRRVLDYAITVIPRNKIFFGFQIYARDWLLPFTWGQEAETFSNQEAVARATKYHAAIMYDTLAQSPFFRYTDELGRAHEVWFEDARSAQAKFDTVKEYGLRGISYWALGFPYPQNWALLEDNFTIRKLIP